MEKKILKMIENTRESALVCTWSIGSAPVKNLQNMAIKLNEKIQDIVDLDKSIVFDAKFATIFPYVNMIRRAAKLSEISPVDFMQRRMSCDV